MVRTVSVCRILVVPRSAYNTIAAAFPIGARTVLTNLLARAQEVGSPPCARHKLLLFDSAVFECCCHAS
jgi:hypothetical protein